MKAKVFLYTFASIVLFVSGMVSYKENLFPRQFLLKLKSILSTKETKLASELNEQSTAKNATPPKIRYHMLNELLYSVTVIMRMKSVQQSLNLVMLFNHRGTLMET